MDQIEIAIQVIRAEYADAVREYEYNLDSGRSIAFPAGRRSALALALGALHDPDPLPGQARKGDSPEPETEK